MDLHLETDEAHLLATVLRNYLADLREEIYKTEKFDWRQALHRDETTIKSILSRLGEPVELHPSPTAVGEVR